MWGRVRLQFWSDTHKPLYLIGEWPYTVVVHRKFGKIFNFWLNPFSIYMYIYRFYSPFLNFQKGISTAKNPDQTMHSPSQSDLGLPCLGWNYDCQFFSYTYFVCESIWDVSGRLFLSSVGRATTTWLIGTGLILLPRGTCHCWGILVQLCWSGTLLKLWSLNPCRLLTRPTTCEQVPLRLKAERIVLFIFPHHCISGCLCMQHLRPLFAKLIIRHRPFSKLLITELTWNRSNNYK